MEWRDLWGADRPEGALAMSAYLGAPRPQPTYVPKLDQLLGGGMLPGVTVVGGTPSAGKSVLACQVAALLAAHGVRVAYASYEMGWEVVQLRCASAWSSTPGAAQAGAEPFAWSGVVNGAYRSQRPEYAGLSRAELSRYLVGSAMDPVARTLTLWDEGPGRNLAVLTAPNTADELSEGLGSVAGEPPVLVVDYLQIMPTDHPDQSEYERVSESINALQRHVTSGRGRFVLAVSSTRNLSSQERKEGPSMSWLRGSGYMQYAAEQIVMLTVDMAQDAASGQMVPSTASNGWTEGRMTVVKNKAGAQGVSVATLMAGWSNWIQ